jgi:DNA-binding GntR family transcriptional regulator
MGGALKIIRNLSKKKLHSVLYRQRNNGWFVIKWGLRFDNRFVVTTNLALLKKFGAHINVEWCNKSIFIKYIFKYVTKGPNHSKVFLQRVRDSEDVPYSEETDSRDEVKEYLDSRCICDRDSC